MLLFWMEGMVVHTLGTGLKKPMANVTKHIRKNFLGMIYLEHVQPTPVLPLLTQSLGDMLLHPLLVALHNRLQSSLSF